MKLGLGLALTAQRLNLRRLVPVDVPPAEAPAVVTPLSTSSSSALVGQTLTVTTGEYSGEPAPGFRTYQWYRDGVTPIDNTDSTTYTVIEADNGHGISVTETASNPSGAVTSSLAYWTGGVAQGLTAMSPPTIVGTPSVTLSGTTATLSAVSTTGWPKPRLSYVWKKDGVSIDGEFGTTLTTTGAGVYTVVVTALSLGTSVNKTSNSVTYVAAPAYQILEFNPTTSNTFTDDAGTVAASTGAAIAVAKGDGGKTFRQTLASRRPTLSGTNAIKFQNSTSQLLESTDPAILGLHGSFTKPFEVELVINFQAINLNTAMINWGLSSSNTPWFNFTLNSSNALVTSVRNDASSSTTLSAGLFEPTLNTDYNVRSRWVSGVWTTWINGNMLNSPVDSSSLIAPTTTDRFNINGRYLGSSNLSQQGNFTLKSLILRDLS